MEGPPCELARVTLDLPDPFTIRNEASHVCVLPHPSCKRITSRENPLKRLGGICLFVVVLSVETRKLPVNGHSKQVRLVRTQLVDDTTQTRNGTYNRFLRYNSACGLWTFVLHERFVMKSVVSQKKVLTEPEDAHSTCWARC